MRRLPWLALVALALPATTLAEPGLQALSVTANEDGSQTYTLTLQVLVLMTALTLLPAIDDDFIHSRYHRLGLLRQAIGTAQTPSSQVLIGLAPFITFFVMTPVLDQVFDEAVSPYLNEKLSVEEAAQRASKPLREFMLAQTRESDPCSLLTCSPIVFELCPWGQKASRAPRSEISSTGVAGCFEAVLIALPAITAMMVVNLSFGVMPQLNIFAVGFPVMLIRGSVVMLLTLSSLESHLVRLFDEGFRQARQLMGGLAHGGRAWQSRKD